MAPPLILINRERRRLLPNASLTMTLIPPGTSECGGCNGDIEDIPGLYPSGWESLIAISEWIDATDDGHCELPESANCLIVGIIEVKTHLGLNREG